MEQRLISPASYEDDKTDFSLRPKNLSQFIGQKQLRENLNVFICAAREREEPMDHVLFYGPPGLGKTTLSHIVSQELGVGFRSTSGPVIAKGGDLAALLTNLQPRDVLFIDEIHRLLPKVEEILYPAMEDFRLDLMIGEGPAARSVQIDLPPFTLIGATTRSGLLSTPFRDRFGIPLCLNFYQEDELVQIISNNAIKLSLNLTQKGALEIARRSRGTPRIAGRLLRRVRDFALVSQKEKVDHIIADAALSRLDVDELGLDSQDRRYLMFMAQHYGGGPVGIETLCAGLSEEKDNLEDVLEPYLLQQGFIQRTSRGRVLSARTWSHLKLDPPCHVREKFDFSMDYES